ncbi:5'-nucleotidase [Sphingomonas sp. XXL09]|uniref:5'-nucleotidase n=1 Tax=Sphingomonas sp. XXL09 TaxID=3457787 RepID=UPI00406BA025
MRLAVLMAMQAASATYGPPLPPEMVAKAKPLLPRRCDGADAGADVVVCGRSADANRVGRMDDARYREKPVRAATRIGKVGLVAEGEQAGLPGGIPIHRAMLRAKIPF